MRRFCGLEWRSVQHQFTNDGEVSVLRNILLILGGGPKGPRGGKANMGGRKGPMGPMGPMGTRPGLMGGLGPGPNMGGKGGPAALGPRPAWPPYRTKHGHDIRAYFTFETHTRTLLSCPFL